jgi:hypothetical protein
MIFSEITDELKRQLKSNLPQIMILLKNNPAMAYTKITEIGFGVGRKYKIQLIVNFPQLGKIEDFDSYGTQDLSMIIDRQRKNFPIQRSIIKEKAKEIFGDIQVDDAYMYEGKEGVKVYPPGGRIDILPHSIHIWCKFDEKVTEYCNWLLVNVYLLGQDSKLVSS